MAFVTGANRGVGPAYVSALLDRVALRVQAAARNEAGLARTIVLDLTDPTRIAAAVRAAPGVTLLVNNAGVLIFGGALDVSPEAMAHDMAVNFTGLTGMSQRRMPCDPWRIGTDEILDQRRGRALEGGTRAWPRPQPPVARRTTERRSARAPRPQGCRAG